MIERQFFELLQVAIGTRQSLSSTPSANEWAELFAISKKQALVAVAFHGLSILKERNSGINNFGSSLGIDMMTYTKWLSVTAKVAERNKQINEECLKLTNWLKHDGFHCCILKGQSNLAYYPEELRECRTSGDIDVLFRSIENPSQVNTPIRYCLNRARLANKETPQVTYHHTAIVWKGSIVVEGHYRASFLCSPLRNYFLQHWLEENMPWHNSGTNTAECTSPAPSVYYNAIYQLLHMYKHLFETGIGLRQLLDYYFLLRAFHDEQNSLPERTESVVQSSDRKDCRVISKMEIMHTLGKFGMKKFTGAVMYVLQKVLAMPDSNLLCPANEEEGKFLLNEILMAGNFGQYDDRIKVSSSQFGHAWEKLKHNFRLIKHYPEEVLWEPWFRLYHWIWRKCELWRIMRNA